MKQNHIPLGKVTKIRTGKLDANANDPRGEYPFFTCAINPLKISSYSYNCECVLVAGNGDLNIKYYSGKFDAYQRTYIVESSDKELLLTRYLYHFLDNYLIQLRKLSIGGVIKYIKMNNLTDTVIPLPPLPEQKRIAAILDKADAIRRKRQQAIKLADEFLRSVFLDMFGDPVTNPKGWPSKTLSEIAEVCSGVTKGRNFSNKKTVFAPYMRVANVQDGHLILNDVTEIEVLPNDVQKYALKKGDVLLTEGGDPDKLGRGAVWHGEIEPCIHQNHIFKVRPHMQFVLPQYLSSIIASARGKRYFLRAAKQTTGIATISITQLKGFSVLLPPIEMQKKYNNVFDSVNKILDKFKGKQGDNSLLFNSLIQKIFKGEL